MQKNFTAEEIQQLKAASAKAHDGRVVQIDLDDPINATFIAAPFSFAEYATFYDARHLDPPTANHGVLMRQGLYPGFAEIEALRQEWPSVAEKVTVELVEEAGSNSETALVHRLDLDALPVGLDKTTAAKLLEDAKGGRLWSVDLPGQGLACVMRAPLADTWLGAQTSYLDALAGGKGIVASIESFALGAVVWPAREALTGGTGLLDRKPALIWDLWAAYKRTGGSGAAARRKSL